MGTHKITIQIDEEHYQKYKELASKGVKWRDILYRGMENMGKDEQKYKEIVDYIKELIDRADSLKAEMVLQLADAINAISSFMRRIDEFMSEYLENLRARIEKLETENKRLKALLQTYYTKEAKGIELEVK